MSLRGVLSKKRNPEPILLPTLPNTICTSSPSNRPSNVPTPDRVIPNPRNPREHRQGKIPSLLLIQRHPRNNPSSNTYPINNHNSSASSRRPRKLQPRKPPGNPNPHPTRMILPICIRHPTINP